MSSGTVDDFYRTSITKIPIRIPHADLRQRDARHCQQNARAANDAEQASWVKNARVGRGHLFCACGVLRQGSPGCSAHQGDIGAVDHAIGTEIGAEVRWWPSSCYLAGLSSRFSDVGGVHHAIGSGVAEKEA